MSEQVVTNHRSKAGAVLVFLLLIMLQTLLMAVRLQNHMAANHETRALQWEASIIYQQHQQQQQQQQKATTVNFINDFADGELNVDPILPRQCVSVRFRGDPTSYPVDEAIDVLKERYAFSPGPRRLRIGIMMMEEVDKFFPVRIRESGNNYHLYHFIEFLVMAYAELHRIASSLPATENTLEQHSQSIPTLAQGNPAVSVPWIFSPYISPSEICGGPASLNCLAADLTLRASSKSIFQDKTGIVGLDPMENYAFNYTNAKAKAVSRRVALVEAENYYSQRSFSNNADAVLTVERFGCNMAGINKPWSKYIDRFPADQWHSDILEGLRLQPRVENNDKLVVGYVDRQNTDRHLPPEHHEWLVDYFSSHSKVQFLQLHMENYSALEQVLMAAKCDVLIGMHGNGLTHQLWMRPGGYVIEYFWKYNYQFDYATASQLLNHTYLGILNGRVIPREKVAKRDPSLREHPTRKEAQHALVEESMKMFEEEGKPAIEDLIETAIRERNL